VTHPPLLLVAHGTREPTGPREIERLAAAVARQLGVPVHPAYVDVIGPTVADVLGGLRGPVVVLPAFLAAGYHVRVDLPAQIADAGLDAHVLMADSLGPAPELAEAMLERLRARGWRPGIRVVFSAAGSSDEHALADVRSAATLLGRQCGQWLRPSYITTAQPLTADLCTPGSPAFIAPYLLAPGLFHRKLAELPAASTAEPIGAHPRVIDLIARRYHSACLHGRSVA
jgi:sirohydrochlorin ferrochelatase